MTLRVRCSQCDAPLDPYGREGGDAWCEDCREGRPVKPSVVLAKWPEHWTNPCVTKKRAKAA